MIERAREHNGALANVEWIVGNGVSLQPLGEASVTAVVSHVVFQHIPDPQITLGYVREIGRVLAPGGWAAFQVSNDPGLHQARGGALARLRGLGHARPKGQSDPAWVGSAIDLRELRAAAAESGLELERIEGEGTQFCMVLARRALRSGSPAAAA
jgi:SAM-dependent methyltransferase